MDSFNPAIRDYVDLGYKDYVAARTLLLNEMLLQGAGLVSCAVEKYTKSYAIARGKPLKKNHIGEDFIADLKTGIGLPPHVSENFLTFLGKCYSLRYVDKIPAGFNLCIRQRQLLAELDETILAYERAFTQTKDGVRVPTQCQTAVQSKDPRIATENWILNGITKTDFIEQRDAVYEIRFFGPSNQIEVTYYTEKGKNDGDFLKAAFVEESPTQFQLAFLPLPWVASSPLSEQVGPGRVRPVVGRDGGGLAGDEGGRIGEDYSGSRL